MTSEPHPLAPWLARQLTGLLARRGHAWLLHGLSGLGPFELALASARLPGGFKAQPAAFFEAVRAAYVRRLREAPERIVRIDASQPREAVWAAVWVVVQKHMA